MPGFNYDPAIGSFKNWLMQLTHWKIADQLRSREREISRIRPSRRRRASESSTGRTDTTEKIPDPNVGTLEAAWNQE